MRIGAGIEQGWPRAESNADAGVAGRALSGLAGGDHVCCAFESDEAQLAMLGRFARDAIGRGQRLLFLSHGTRATTVLGVIEAARAQVGGLLTPGQVEIREAQAQYGGQGGFDPETQIAGFAGERSRALSDGFPGLAVMAEMSWAADERKDWEALLRYEGEVEEIFASADVCGLCQYDRRAFPESFIARVLAAHAFSITVAHGASHSRCGALTIAEDDGPAMRVAGELDLVSAPYLAARVREQLERGATEVVIDTSEVTFADVAGTRAFVEAASELADPRRVVLTRTSPALMRVLDICGWLHWPRLEVSASGHSRR